MKSLFVEVKYKGDISLTKEVFEQTADTIVLCSNIQYLDFLEDVKAALEEKGKKVILFKSRHGQYPGQILGCDVFSVKEEHDSSSSSFSLDSGIVSLDKERLLIGEDVNDWCFLYIGDGLFHPTALLFRNSVPVVMYEPRGQSITLLGQKDLGRLKKQKMARLAKFIQAKTIGVLVTRKPGQNQKRAIAHFRLEMEERMALAKDKGLPGAEKDILVFLTDNINFSKLEDFNFIDMWVNTGCPRIIQDFSCVNLRDLTEIGYFSGKDMVF